MPTFHVNLKTLEPGCCRAKKSCPFGGEEIHFSSLQEAQGKAELMLSERMDTFMSKGDFELGEVVKLGEFYDTAGGEATVVAVEREQVQFKSYDDGETYWVDKNALRDPDSSQFVARKDESGVFVEKEAVLLKRAEARSEQLWEQFKDLPEEKHAEIDELWSYDTNNGDEVRTKALKLAKDLKRFRHIDALRTNMNVFLNGKGSKNFGAVEALEDLMIAEAVKDKLTPEEYYALAHPVLRVDSPLRRLVD